MMANNTVDIKVWLAAYTHDHHAPSRQLSTLRGKVNLQLVHKGMTWPVPADGVNFLSTLHDHLPPRALCHDPPPPASFVLPQDTFVLS